MGIFSARSRPKYVYYNILSEIYNLSFVSGTDAPMHLARSCSTHKRRVHCHIVYFFSFFFTIYICPINFFLSFFLSLFFLLFDKR